MHPFFENSFIWEIISQIAYAASEHLEFSMGKNIICVSSGLGPALQTTSCSCLSFGWQRQKAEITDWDKNCFLETTMRRVTATILVTKAYKNKAIYMQKIPTDQHKAAWPQENEQKWWMDQPNSCFSQTQRHTHLLSWRENPLFLPSRHDESLIE